jgi:hypothetical protein
MQIYVSSFQIIMQEELEWIPPYEGEVPTLDEMLTWKVIGPVSL